MSQAPLSVTELVRVIKEMLEGSFDTVWLKGEVSNLSSSATGHYYFTLSDNDSSISVALFVRDALRNPLIKRLKDGDAIECFGELNVFLKRGTFQLVAKRIIEAGVGTAAILFEQQKERLKAEGLFDPERKKVIPKFPSKVAVITSKQGAALADFLQILERRHAPFSVIVIDSLVQGSEAPKSIMNSFKMAVKYHETVSLLDLIVLCRGGGASEDLAAFNSEELVRMVAASPVPVISAVGHEIDFSLCDFVADLRAETPSAAAEILSQGYFDAANKLHYLRGKLQRALPEKIERYKQKLAYLSPRAQLKMMQMNAFQAKERLRRGHRFLQGFSKHSQLIKTKENQLESLNRILQNLHPDKVLDRGYTYIQRDNGEIVSTYVAFEKVQKNEKLQIVFKDGKGHVVKKEVD